MQTKRQINEVLLRCKGGTHQKDKRYKLQKEKDQEFKQILKNL
jgi:Na+-transporting NADH:ubiquinone oxidoreductase subunit NqrA